MTKLRRCSPEIERELHDKEARIRELEGRINKADRYLALGSPNGAREALAPPDSEPAEGEDDPRKDCPWKCGPDDRHCLCLANANLSRQDALERREALEALDRLAEWTLEDYDDAQRIYHEDKELIHRYLSRTSDEGTGCVVPETIRRLPDRWEATAERMEAREKASGASELAAGTHRGLAAALRRAIAQSEQER